MKIIEIPFWINKETEGAKLAPSKVLLEIRELNLSEEGILPNFTIERVETIESNFEETINIIYEKSKEVLQGNVKPLFLGGDHSITFPIVKAFSEVYSKNPGIIIFDAHPDLMSELNEPTHE